jgi:Protein of unknown function (DUF732)
MRMLVVLASFTAVIGVATPAQADPSGNDSGRDASFLTALENAGITFQSKAEAIAVGKRACTLMDQGHPASDVIKSVSAGNPGFTMDSATKFTAIATNTYCPQHLGEPTTQPPPPPPPETWPEFPWPAPPGAF